jgi:LDH2 family malate/lactate/ureidoglycolate dehydrogenase
MPVLGTNPIALSAPARRNRPFLLDMATSTVAANKVKVYQFKDKQLPPGWVLDAEGAPVLDPHAAMDWIFKHPEGGLSPIGGTAEMGSHKGYGLGVVAQLLAGALAGASFGPLRVKTQVEGDPDNIGHFFLALNPAFFRPAGAFEADADDIIDVLHGTPAADPAEPVLVPGDPEAAARAERMGGGIPVTEALARQIRALCEGCGAEYLLRPRA